MAVRAAAGNVAEGTTQIASGNTDLSRTMWMVAHLLEGLHEKLEAAEMEG